MKQGRAHQRTKAPVGFAAPSEVRELVRMDENLVPLLLPIGDGLLVAVKRPS